MSYVKLTPDSWDRSELTKMTTAMVRMVNINLFELTLLSKKCFSKKIVKIIHFDFGFFLMGESLADLDLI